MTRKNEALRAKIISLALQGNTSKEIIFKCNCDLSEKQVNKYIHNLSVPKQVYYDPTTYNQIVFQRELQKNKIIDKDFLDEIITLALQGYLFIEIAVMYQQKESDIKEQIKLLNLPSSPFQNQDLYQRIIQIQNKIIESQPQIKLFLRLEKLEKEYGADLRTIANSTYINTYYKWKLIQAYIQSNFTLTDDQLATQFGYSKHSVQYFFNNREFLLHFIDEETLKRIQLHRQKAIKEIREKNKVKFSQKSLTHSKLEDQHFQRFQVQIVFWIKLMLSFRISLTELAFMIGVTDLTYLNDLLYKYSYGTIFNRALIYLFEVVPQNSGNLFMAQNYVKELVQAKKNDQEKYQRLLEQIDDSKYYSLIDSKSRVEQLSDEEKQIVIRYCFKYALPYRSIPYNEKSISNLCMKYDAEENERIRKFNKEIYKIYLRNRKKKDAFYN